MSSGTGYADIGLGPFSAARVPHGLGRSRGLTLIGHLAQTDLGGVVGLDGQMISSEGATRRQRVALSACWGVYGHDCRISKSYSLRVDIPHIRSRPMPGKRNKPPTKPTAAPRSIGADRTKPTPSPTLGSSPPPNRPAKFTAHLVPELSPWSCFCRTLVSYDDLSDITCMQCGSVLVPVKRKPSR